ncbi:MAG: AEC family transporter [Rhodospirillales bacterium]|nr:MAG: AEC family transporter [Rhodospirillales bacterium]
MAAALFTVMAPVLICVAIGVAWDRAGKGFDVDLVTVLITNVGAPCLVFHTLANLTVSAEAFATMVAAALLVLAVNAPLAAGVLRLARLPQRTFLPALVFANTGNVGLPLSFLAFGEAGLGLAIGVFAVHSVAMFIFGPALAAGTISWRGLLRVPVLYALPPALAFMIIDLPPPGWINATTKLLGDITIPMMLIALGVSLGRLKVASAGRSLALSLLRLGIGFGVGVSVAWLFGLEGVARGVLILQSTMPAAVFTYLFAQRYGRAPQDVAGVVVISTVIAFATMPLLLLYVL